MLLQEYFEVLFIALKNSNKYPIIEQPLNKCCIFIQKEH